MSLILATGGLGFVGSHTCIELLINGYDVLVIDSLINSSIKVIERIKKASLLSKKEKIGNFFFVEGDIRNYKLISKVFKEFRLNEQPISSVIHFAGLKFVDASIKNPLDYWDVNVNGTINLLKVMKENKCHNFVFSSSATIYKSDSIDKIKESAFLDPINPYGNTKFAIEKILNDLFNSEKTKWKFANLRYFNPVGAHPSGIIGEDPQKESTNLFPVLIKVINKELDYLPIFGNDWPTYDGSCIRDFIHIVDLAEAHLLSLRFLIDNEPQNIKLNIGTGEGTSVLEIVKAFKDILNLDVRYKFHKRRKGDYPCVVADNTKVKYILGWKPKKNLADMCKDSWNWNLKKGKEK